MYVVQERTRQDKVVSKQYEITSYCGQAFNPRIEAMAIVTIEDYNTCWLIPARGDRPRIDILERFLNEQEPEWRRYIIFFRGLQFAVSNNCRQEALCDSQ